MDVSGQLHAPVATTAPSVRSKDWNIYQPLPDL
jgi:hypothetical protein